MELNKYIEHTLLKQDTTQNALLKLCDEAVKYNFFGVCVNGCNTKNIKNILKDTDVKVVTVIGFPLGSCTTETKVFETQNAINNGADEIDMVINVQALKDKNFEYVKNDIKQVKKTCGDTILKVIIETDLLSKEEIIKACELIIESKADFAKTSTGFVKNGIGAKVEDVELMYTVLQNTNVKIKASGGIKTKEQAIKLIEAGAIRLGTSSGVDLIK